MQYLLSIYYSADQDQSGPPLPGTFPDWVDATRALHEAGVLVAGDGLKSPETATTVRVAEDGLTLTDGPFAETKDLLVGFYVIDVPDLDTALSWAKRLPNSGELATEVRPLADSPASARAFLG